MVRRHRGGRSVLPFAVALLLFAGCGPKENTQMTEQGSAAAPAVSASLSFSEEGAAAESTVLADTQEWRERIFRDLESISAHVSIDPDGIVHSAEGGE